MFISIIFSYTIFYISLIIYIRGCFVLIILMILFFLVLYIENSMLC